MRTVVFVDSQGINRGISLLGKTGYYVPNQRNKVSAFALNSLEVGDFVYVWQCVLGREHIYLLFAREGEGASAWVVSFGGAGRRKDVCRVGGAVLVTERSTIGRSVKQ